MVVYMHLIWTCGVQEKITDGSNVYILFVVGSRLFFFTFFLYFLGHGDLGCRGSFATVGDSYWKCRSRTCRCSANSSSTHPMDMDHSAGVWWKVKAKERLIRYDHAVLNHTDKQVTIIFSDSLITGCHHKLLVT